MNNVFFLGIAVHELGHTMNLVNEKYDGGIMHRGYDNIQSFFLPNENFNVLESNKERCSFDEASSIVLTFNPWLRIKEEEEEELELEPIKPPWVKG